MQSDDLSPSISTDDFLSFCPSLLLILTELHHRQILTSKLVSRRFYTVIKRNQVQMQRRNAQIEIRKGRSWDSSVISAADSVFVELRDNSDRRLLSLNVFENCIVVNACNIKGLMGSYGVEAFPYAFDNNQSVEDGLKIVLNLIMKYYQLNSMKLFCCSPGQGSPVPDSWYSVVINQLRESRSRCHLLILSDNTPFDLVLSKKEFYTIFINSSSGMAPYLETLIKLEMPLRITFRSELALSLEPLRDLIEGWRAGSYRIRELCLACRNRELGLWWQTTNRHLVAVSLIASLDIECCLLGIEDDEVMFCFRRHGGGDLLLCVCCMDAGLLIYDVIHAGQPHLYEFDRYLL